MFDLVSESDLTLLPDAEHVLAKAGGEEAAQGAPDPPEDLVSSLLEEVDTDRALGEPPPPSPHSLKHDVRLSLVSG